MRALSLTQPFATLVALGEKRIETRSWLTRYRGQIAIHAARGLSLIGGKRGLRALCKERPFAKALHDPSDPRRPVDARLPRGAIVAVAEFVDVLPISERLPLPPDLAGRFLWSRERHFGDYTPGRYLGALADAHADHLAADMAEAGMPCTSPGCPEVLRADGNVLRCPMHGPMLLLEFAR